MSSSYASPVLDDNVEGDERYPWRAAYREALTPYVFRRVLALLGLYLVAWAALCPLGINDLTWTQRAVFITLSLGLCAPLCYAEYVVTLYLTRSWTRLGVALAVVGATFLAVPTATVIAYGVDTLLFPEVLAVADLQTVYLIKTLSILFCTAVVHYLVNGRVAKGTGSGPLTPQPRETPAANAPDRPAATPAAAGPEAATSGTTFIRRLPEEAGPDVIYLKMSDHYVEVVTGSGRYPLLMRFADAIDELGDAGIRVHRSYWVALRHVEGWAKHKQRPFLRLTGGDMIPVSRTYLPAARATIDGQQTRQGKRETESP